MYGLLGEKVNDVDAYVAYMTLSAYCEERGCLQCMFCLNSTPCCAFYNRNPEEFPSLVLGEGKYREVLESLKKWVEDALEEKRL